MGLNSHGDHHESHNISIRNPDVRNERIESLNARITEQRQAGYDKVAMTLDSGQTWQQIDSSSLRLRVGDDVRIERASLGSCMLHKAGSKRTMRVKRRD